MTHCVQKAICDSPLTEQLNRVKIRIKYFSYAPRKMFRLKRKDILKPITSFYRTKGKASVYNFNQFQTNVPFRFLSENERFSNISRGYKNGTSA